jgi:hypothetical protein
MSLIDVKNQYSVAAVFQIIPNARRCDVKKSARIFATLASAALRKTQQTYENEQIYPKRLEAHESMVLNAVVLGKSVCHSARRIRSDKHLVCVRA